jgi:hypothetical protein
MIESPKIQNAINLKAYEYDRMRGICRTIDKSWQPDLANWWFRSELFAIIPKASLGRLGVLNFGAKRAKELILLGYKDALQQLRDYCAAKHKSL